MLIKKYLYLISIVALGATSSAVLAQKGSRVCGYTTDTQDGAIGMLYEVRQGSNEKAECDDAIDYIKSLIQADPALRPLKWAEQRRDECEGVGKLFTSNSMTSTDICDKMSARTNYKVVKDDAANKTSFTKLADQNYGSGI